VESVPRAGRPLCAEQLLDQSLGADQLARVHQQDREQRALTLAAERQRLTLARRSERSKDGELDCRHRLCPH
jgi:ribosomal protein L32